LTRLEDYYLEDDGVRSVIADENEKSVACRASQEVLEGYVAGVKMVGRLGDVFETNRELIESVTSEFSTLMGPLDDQGRVLVTSEARATRHA
jgi:hypothetical protein